MKEQDQPLRLPAHEHHLQQRLCGLKCHTEEQKADRSDTGGSGMFLPGAGKEDQTIKSYQVNQHQGVQKNLRKACKMQFLRGMHRKPIGTPTAESMSPALAGLGSIA